MFTNKGADVPTETQGAKFVKTQLAVVGAKKLTRSGAPRTTAWSDSRGRDLKIGDTFKYEGSTGTVAGRFTKPDKDGNREPYISSDDHGPRCLRVPAASVTFVAPRSK